MRLRFAAPLSILAGLVAGLVGSALAAQLPTGADDFRISFMGGTGDTVFRAVHPDVAYNATDHEYLVVWQGDTDTGGEVDDRFQIFAQRIDAASGAAIGAEVQISAMTATLGFTPPYNPAVAWDGTHNQYLVVWSGITGLCCEFDYEIFARRIEADGTPLATAIQISHMVDTVPNEAHFDASDPALVYNSTADEFLVVWSGDDGRNGRLNDEFEIHGQRLAAATGAPVGADDFRISDAGGTGNTLSHAYRPRVAYNAIDDEYLVVWWGEDLDAGTVDQEYEIYGQRLDGATAAELGANDLRISAAGPVGNPSWQALYPTVAHNPDDDEYLVVWSAPETLSGTFIGFELFAQRLDALGAEIGVDDFRLTDVGGLGEAGFDVETPDVTYSAASGRYLVAFRADDDLGGQIYAEREIHVQAIAGATGAEVGPNDLRITDMGPNGATAFGAFFPALAADAEGGFLAVWTGDDNSGGLVDNEYEIFGQRLAGGPFFADGFESGGTGAWSVSAP